ncbi:hypothetical protein TRFO_11110 [Tritrichomonas foetus]|uniref:Replication termination factor 2 n=1 Tax=Tritrichomonas foetus TaxID=1144522 RepID=A0A1J4J8C6_9EUKA|nr:hypothetical protein TRFO_11110 [Tritrichomonas foetus]|eukprot:OHS94487.1 hypothetical protein TRFO_11110 [Tritrichomonas foetus]
MGLDGGCLLKRPDMVAKTPTADRRMDRKERNAEFARCCWTLCTLAGEPLQIPVVVSKKGQFFNQNSIMNALLEGSLPKRLRKLKKKSYWKEVDLLGAKNLVEYVCPVSGKSPTPGTVDSWIVIFKCGHIFLEIALKQLKVHECPVCGCKFESSDVINITPLHRPRSE